MDTFVGCLQASQIKYRLPSDPTVWVDLVDDDDVAVSQRQRCNAIGGSDLAGREQTGVSPTQG
jgi:hypothetical protein